MRAKNFRPPPPTNKKFLNSHHQKGLGIFRSISYHIGGIGLIGSESTIRGGCWGALGGLRGGVPQISGAFRRGGSPNEAPPNIFRGLIPPSRPPFRPPPRFSRALERGRWLRVPHTSNCGCRRALSVIWVILVDGAWRGGVGNILDLRST